MHKIKFFLYAVLLSSALFSAELNWLHDYNKALEIAKKEQKGVYMFVGADVCRWCDRFKDVTLSKKEVIKRLEEEYVLLYLSRDRHQIPKHFEVKGVPRHYFLRNDGSLIHADRGSREVDGFFALLDEVSLKK
jgi:thioredoxin-related protein